MAGGAWPQAVARGLAPPAGPAKALRDARRAVTGKMQVVTGKMRAATGRPGRRAGEEATGRRGPLVAGAPVPGRSGVAIP